MGSKGEISYGWEMHRLDSLMILKEELIATDSSIEHEIQIDKEFDAQMKRDIVLYDQESE